MRYTCTPTFRGISTHALTWSATLIYGDSSVYPFISTHALTWSATLLSHSLNVVHILFQLTRSRGARLRRRIWIMNTKVFQLTRSRGARPSIIGSCLGIMSISTHALTWSATKDFRNFLSRVKHFNSRAHVERDIIAVCSAVVCAYFNSRAHVERDPAFAKYQFKRLYFNSRAHVERDRKCRRGYPILVISTHALTWSATVRFVIFVID